MVTTEEWALISNRTLLQNKSAASPYNEDIVFPHKFPKHSIKMSRMPRKRTDRTRVQKEIAYLKKKDRRPRTIIIIDVVLFVRGEKIIK